MRNPEAQQFLATKSGCLGVLTGLVVMFLVSLILVGALIAGVWFFRH